MSSATSSLLIARTLAVLCGAASVVGGCSSSAPDEPSGAGVSQEATAPQASADQDDDGKGDHQKDLDPKRALEVKTDQIFPDLRPEFLDYFWNNLDAERFTAWHPEAHTAFAWTSAPKVPGDLGAEVGAAYTSQVKVAGASHEVAVKYVAPKLAPGEKPLESLTVADVTIDGDGPYRLLVQYQQEKDDLRVQQTLALPAGADQKAWQAYLEQRMTALSKFIRARFQAHYVEGELTKRGKIEVRNGTTTMDVVVTQNIGKVTADQVSWWWDNMGETERYRHWHPTAHQSFTWTTPPKNAKDLFYDVGSVQKIVEVIGQASTLNITWLNPSEVPIDLTYDTYIYGKTNLDGTPFGGFLVHEYDDLPAGGVVMKSTFRVDLIAGPAFAKALGEHCIQEMQFLQYYLPRLFAKEYTKP